MVTIAAFQAENQAQVKDLILAGLAEHWGVLDLTLNPDLNDIQAHYAHGLFLVARSGSCMVGCGALIPRETGVAEIVRMSVAADMRRQGIGKQILQELIKEARERGFSRIILETTETWKEVIEFYLKNGFQITHYQDGNVYFLYDLGSAGHE